MNRLLAALVFLCSTASFATAPADDIAAWATATSTHATNGRVIVFRYVKEFRPGFEKSSLPDRVILVWRYVSQTGMPIPAERQKMDELEDLLAPLTERPGFAMLTLVSTGENLREWTYYVKSEAEFLKALNDALAGKQVFPIEIHAAPDPKWSTFLRFRHSVHE